MRDLFFTSDPRPLRPHQVQAIEHVRSVFALGKTRVVLQAPTGFGKTVTAATIVKAVLERHRRVLFIVPRLALVDQCVAEFAREGIPHIGVIQGQHVQTDHTAPVQVASAQTLARRLVTDSFGLVIVDECHESHKTIRTLMKDWAHIPFLGLSATPWAKGMAADWEELCVASTVSELIDAGYLSQIAVFAPDNPDLTGVPIRCGDYGEADLQRVMSAPILVASVVQTWLSKGENRPTLCFAVNRAHARFLHQEFERVGIPTAYCDGNTEAAERALIRARFLSGELRIICSVRTMTTGVDLPVSCIIDAAPTKSEILHVQKIGRGLRVNPGTEDLIVLDHAGNALRIGLISEIHHKALLGGMKKQRKAQERKVSLPSPCVECGVLHTGQICPACGHVRKRIADVETADGELVQITGKPKNKASRAEMQSWWSGLLHIEKAHLRKPGWAKYTFRARFGTAPRGLSNKAEAPSAEVINFAKARDIAYAKKANKEHPYAPNL